MLNPLYVGALARALMLVLGARGFTLSESDAGVFASAAVALVALIWSLRQKQQQIQREQ